MKRKLLLPSPPSQASLAKLVREVFDAEIVDSQGAGTGLLGYVYAVRLTREPHEAIIKFQKYAGKAKPEADQLDLLRIFAEGLVPQVFHIHLPTDELPFEALVLEKLPGIQASNVKNPPIGVQKAIADQIVEIALRWHDVGHLAGYGPLNGPFFERWSDYQRSVVQTRLEEVLELHPGGYLAPPILEAAQRSIERIDAILGDVRGGAVLVHGDIWLPNVLIDPETYKVTGLVDPQNCRWDEREMDVVPMDWPYGDYQFLMRRYEQRRPLREGWPLRFAFHRFWFMMEAMYLIGPDPARSEAENLLRLLDAEGV